MIIEPDSIFRYKVYNPVKLLEYGFVEDGKKLIKSVPIMKKQFNMEVSVDLNSSVRFKVIDNALNEEYILVNVESAQGGFVGEVRSACENVLADIANKCFDTEILKAEQTKRIIRAIESSYGAKPEFLWKKHPDCAAFRRNDNKKWFAIIMTIDRGKLGLTGHGNLEIIDLKAEPDFVEAKLKQDGYHPAYHMDKKHWLTVCLDGSLPDEVLLKLLFASYQCSAS